MYMYIKGIEFASLYDASIDFGNVRINVCVSNGSVDKIYFHCK